MPRLPLLWLMTTGLSVAHAQTPAERPRSADPHRYSIALADSWAYDANRSEQVQRLLAGQHHFTDTATDVAVDAYSRDGAALYVLWIEARSAAKPPAVQIVRQAFDDLRTTAAAPPSELINWSERVESNVAHASLESRDRQGGVTTLSRTMMFFSPTGAPRQVRAECMFQSANDNNVRATCEDALSTLAIAPAAPPGPLSSLPSAGPPRPQEASSAGALPPLPATVGDAPALRFDPPNLTATPDSNSPPRVLYQAPPDQQTGATLSDQLMIVAGAVLLATAVYMAARSRRRQGNRGGQP